MGPHPHTPWGPTCRYTDAERAVYRPHIDGSWPGSGVMGDGRYVHDAYGDRRSRLTFLICARTYLPYTY